MIVIGIGATVAGRAPPTAPGMRVRTGRFEKWRSREFWNSQVVEQGNGQDAVQAQVAVVPPSARLVRHLGGQRFCGAQLAQFAEDCRPTPPLFELKGVQ